jgi:hypothetical protein
MKRESRSRSSTIIARWAQGRNDLSLRPFASSALPRVRGVGNRIFMSRLLTGSAGILPACLSGSRSWRPTRPNLHCAPGKSPPESSGSLPENSGSLPGSSGSLPENLGRHPEDSGSHPECSGSLPECLGSHPECSRSLPQCSGSHPECTGILPECTGSLPEKSGVPSLPTSSETGDADCMDPRLNPEAHLFLKPPKKGWQMPGHCRPGRSWHHSLGFVGIQEVFHLSKSGPGSAG